MLPLFHRAAPRDTWRAEGSDPHDETNRSRSGGLHCVRWCFRCRYRVGDSADGNNDTIGHDTHHAGHFTDDDREYSAHLSAQPRRGCGCGCKCGSGVV